MKAREAWFYWALNPKLNTVGGATVRRSPPLQRGI